MTVLFTGGQIAAPGNADRWGAVVFVVACSICVVVLAWRRRSGGARLR